MSERTNVKFCSLNKSQTLQQMKNNTRKATTSFENVGDEFFSLDDGMMMQFDFIPLSVAVACFSKTSCATFFYRAASTNANSSSTIWYSHKLFVFRMAMKREKRYLYIYIGMESKQHEGE